MSVQRNWCSSWTQSSVRSSNWGRIFLAKNTLFCVILTTFLLHWAKLCLTGSLQYRIQRPGKGGQETWNLCCHLWRPSFLWLICTGLGGAWPPRHPPGSATGLSNTMYVETNNSWTFLDDFPSTICCLFKNNGNYDDHKQSCQVITYHNFIPRLIRTVCQGQRSRFCLVCKE